MTSIDPESPSYDELVRQFTEAEQALRALMVSAGTLTSAAAKVDEAHAAMDDAGRATLERLVAAREVLEGSERSLADASSAIYAHTTEVKEVARNLKDSALALRGLRPEELWFMLEEVRREQRRSTRLLIAALVLSGLAVIGSFIS